MYPQQPNSALNLVRWTLRGKAEQRRLGNRVSGTVTTYDAPRGSTEMLPPNTTQFSIDLNKSQEFNVAGVRVRVLAVTETSLTYVLQR